MVKPYDARELGEHLESLQYPLRTLVIFRSMQADVTDVYHLQRMLRSWKSFKHSAKLVARYARDRLLGRRGTRTLRGNALIARLYRSAIDAGVQIIREAPMTELTRTGERISGVVYEHAGKRVALSATRGVILATGGVSGNGRYRSMLLPFAEHHVSMLPEGNVGDGVAAAIAKGASLGESKRANACLTPVSWLKRKDGTVVKYPHLAFDRCKPGSIIVDARGRRFTNEAGTYHDVGKAMQDAGAVPAFLIADSRFQRWYGMGMARPLPYPIAPLLDCGYLIQGKTLAELAGKLGIDATRLAETVERMNQAAKSGVDTDFGRGGNAYNRELGDAEHSPNPCLGEIRHAPFYAVKLYPGDIGTLTGLKVDTHAQVLGQDGRPIPGLSACGLDIDNVFCGFYPGAGSTHGPNITFAYVAASRLAAGDNIQNPAPAADAVAHP
jgi:succinate dehydrogenase/fumarate reductase flavoprotein subunit